MGDTEDVAAAFDPTMKKKKKKKTKEEGTDEVAEATEAVADMNVDDATAMFGEKKKKKKKAKEDSEAAPEKAEGEGEDEFGFGEKKKKKKKPKAEGEEAAVEGAAEDDGGDDVDFSKKKKKKKKGDGDADKAAEEAFADIVKEKASETTDSKKSAQDKDQDDCPWAGSDRDYTYQELLNRVFATLRANNPELGGVRRRFAVKPPLCHRDGTKKTVFDNLVEICEQLHRQPDHMVAYILTELGTSGSIDGNQRLVIRGRFQPKGIENVIRRYVGEYVTCHMCKSPDTTLTKENRLHFLNCESCGASRSVAPIKQGFVALVGKRRNMKPAS